jgi:diguanylate cyclase (GGDEF)-like protein
MTWNSIPLSAAGSLAVCVVALFFAAFQGIFFIKQRKLTSNAWAALFSLSSAGYAFFVFLQFIAPPTPIQQMLDRAQFSFLVLMAYSICGYTISYHQIRGRWFHSIGGPLFILVLGALWLTDLIASGRLVSRFFPWVPRPYVESALGPLGAPFMALLLAAALFSLFLWIWKKTRDKSDRRIFGAGLSVFAGLAIHDALVSIGVMTSVQFVLEYGFLCFATSILYITAREYIGFQSRAAALGRLNEELGAMAITDGLTRLANRRGFDSRFEQECRSLARQNSQKSAVFLSCILCDVDFFKEYNDTYGHQAGDACLVAVAEALARGARRPADLVSRIGGDEFALLLPDTPMEGARIVAESAIAELRALKIANEGSTGRKWVTISMGIASTRADEAITQEQLIARADRALYRAKILGKDRAETSEIDEALPAATP